MPVEITVDTPLANALNTLIPAKVCEMGWDTDGDDGKALSEYILLMLVNGKDQHSVASELASDLLGLDEGDTSAIIFSDWLFKEIERLSNPQAAQDSGMEMSHEAGDAKEIEMGDADNTNDTNDTNIPTGPKSMRNGASSINIRGRGQRMLGQLGKAMDRSHESVLHRVRATGDSRINTHSRGPPSGPRQQAMPGRATPRAMNGRMNNMGGMQMMQGGAAQNIMNMNPQQQMDLFAMLEQQSRMMAQVLGAQPMQMGRGGPMGNGGFPQPNGRPLVERAQPQARGGHNGFQRGAGFQRGGRGGKFGDHQSQVSNDDPSSSMDVEMSQEKKELDPENTRCKYDLNCTNKDCPFGHQSPAAPPQTSVDMKDVCTFGAACKNRKCTGKHPSPAQKTAHQTEQDCKFFPNCTNYRCPFKHPSMPACRNGADCTTPNCKFTHVKIECKFNPCTNPHCVFKHSDGQKRGAFEDKVWVADAAKGHVSERKFVDENAPEELILPGGEGGMDSTIKEELIT